MKRIPKGKYLFGLCLGVVLFTPSFFSSAQTPTRPPNPVLILVGSEVIKKNGNDVAVYRLAVTNHDQYPQEMFAPAPKLPPCGTNTNSSRTWVDLYAYNGRKLHGFCALASPRDLEKLWFELPADVVPPSWVYIELHDRASDTKYKSGLAETTQ